MKTMVKVKLVGVLIVEMEIEHDEDESPTDLTQEEERAAISQAVMTGDAEWDVAEVVVA